MAALEFSRIRTKLRGEGRNKKATTVVELGSSTIVDQLVEQLDFVALVVYTKGPGSKTKKSVGPNIAVLAPGMMVFDLSCYVL